jgi:hypothetical protein
MSGRWVTVSPVENTPDDPLARLMDHRREMESLERAIAELLYRGRSLFIGDMCLPFDLLTQGQQAKYRMEVKQLIQGAE